MAGALYWTTLIAEHTWVKGDQVEPGERYNYALNFLFKSFSQDEPRNWWINIVALAMLALLWPTFIVLRSAASQEKKRSLRALMLLLIFSFLMATPLSLPLWKIIPKLGSIEFPWRWLAVTSIVGAVALAASIPAWMEKARTHFCARSRSSSRAAFSSHSLSPSRIRCAARSLWRGHSLMPC